MTRASRADSPAKSPKIIFSDPEGRRMIKNTVPSFFRDVLRHWHPHTEVDGALVTTFDPHTPLGPEFLKPGPDSPICKKCGLFESGCRSPFFEYHGADRPDVTVVYEGISQAEDSSGKMLSGGPAKRLNDIIRDISEQIDFDPESVRWVPITRCYGGSAQVNVKVKGNWCRLHAIEDLMFHPPKLILAVGSPVLGLLCHKSNAQDWQGYTLTYRGWPDDWLTKEDFVLPRPHPFQPGETIVGHPLFGPPPPDGVRIPIIPIQTPRIIYSYQNVTLARRWKGVIKNAMVMAKKGVKVNTYTRPWYRFVNDPEAVADGLLEILEHPRLLVCYDTETTGLKPLADNAAIVSMMFRWTDPRSGKPKSLGFPWNFRSRHYDNKVVDYIADLAPLVVRVLTECVIVCHNATFDFLYSFFNLPNAGLAGLLPGTREYNLEHDRQLCAMADAFRWDTWHMAYTLRQERGTLGLEMLAYRYVPDMAGYEEDMTLMIALRPWQLFPGAKKASVGEDAQLLIEKSADAAVVDVEAEPVTEDPEAEPPNDGKKAKVKAKTKKQIALERSTEEPNPHYLNIEERHYPTHVVPYVMGDVETCYKAREVLEKRLNEADKYRIPLANPGRLGTFRWFTTPSRHWVYTHLMSPAARTLMRVMARGMHVDQTVLSGLETTMPIDIVAKRAAMQKIDPRIESWCAAELAKDPDWELDLENKTHLRTLLFTNLNLPVQRLTKQGRQKFGETEADWSALMATGQMTEDDKLKYAALDKFTLNKLAVDHPQVRPLQDYRKVFKLYSTYVKPLSNAFNPAVDKKRRVGDRHLCSDGKIHASFLLTGTRGGRLSCRDPNLQQLPGKGEVKKMFTSRFGDRGCIYQSDLSQIELRLMAAACGDPTMVKAFHDKVDLHTLTTSRIYGRPYEHFTKEHFEWLQQHGKEGEAKELELMRRIGKTVNFLTGYGGGAFGLQTVLANSSVYKSIEECESIIDAFFDAYPTMLEFLRYYKKFIENNGVAVSIFGRVRLLEEVSGEDREAHAKALRAGCNHLIQSTASDMMLMALNVIEGLMREENLESQLVSTVHDSLLVDAVRAELPKVHDIIFPVLNNFHDVMLGVFGLDYDLSWLIVPIAGDCEVGPSYYDTRKIPVKDIDWDALLA